MLTLLAHVIAVVIIVLALALTLIGVLGVVACVRGDEVGGKRHSTLERIVSAVVFAITVVTGVLVIAVMVVTW